MGTPTPFAIVTRPSSRKLAERAYAGRHRDPGTMADLLALDHDDLRQALDWLSGTDARRFGRLAGDLGWFWHVHSDFAEGRARVDAALAGLPLDAEEERARLLSAATELAAWHGDIVAATGFGEEAMRAWRELGREVEIGLVLYDLGWGHFFAGENDAARSRLEASLEIHRSQEKIRCSPTGHSWDSSRSWSPLETWTPSNASALRHWPPRRHSEMAGPSISHSTSWLTAPSSRATSPRQNVDIDSAWRRRGSPATRWRPATSSRGWRWPPPGTGMRSGPCGSPRPRLKTSEGSGSLQLPTFWVELIERHLATSRAQLGAEDADAAWAGGATLSMPDAVNEALG